MQLTTGNYRRDVNEPFYRETEQRVMTAFRQILPANWVIIDRHDYREHGDFWITDGQTRLVMDVKCDMWAARTRRLAWERAVIRADGSEEPGWATSGHLDFVIFVAPGVEDAVWPAWVLSVPRWTAYMRWRLQTCSRDQLRNRYQWREIQKWNDDGRCGSGWAIPLKELTARQLVHRQMLV